MLAIRQFDNTVHPSMTLPGLESQLREHGAGADSVVLNFGAQHSDSLPPFIASFANPVHVDSPVHETDPDVAVDDRCGWGELNVATPTRATPSFEHRSQPSGSGSPAMQHSESV